MRSIQEVGKEILLNHPAQFYIFCGTEYGIKKRYINILKNYYKKQLEYDSVEDVLKIMKKKHLLPLVPTLYVVRYDSEFIKSLSNLTVQSIQNTKIIGTIVCIYESDSDTKKCGKYLSDYSVELNPVSQKYIEKYLIAEFPTIPNTVLSFLSSINIGYAAGQITCYSIQNLSSNKINLLQQNEIKDTFTIQNTFSVDAFKTAIASRNSAYCIQLLDTYTGQLEELFYHILNVLLEIEKLISNPKKKSYYSRYLKSWNEYDMYTMFRNTYRILSKSRLQADYSLYNGLVYTLCMLSVSPVISDSDAF